MSFRGASYILQAKHDIGLLLIAYKMRENSKDAVDALQKAHDIVKHYCDLYEMDREEKKEMLEDYQKSKEGNIK